MPELIAQAYAAMSDQEAERVQAGFAAAAARPVTLRANALKTTPGEVAEKLTERGIPFERVPWYEDAFVLGDGVREKTVWELELYQEGKVYLQSLSSMLPPSPSPHAMGPMSSICAPHRAARPPRLPPSQAARRISPRAR